MNGLVQLQLIQQYSFKTAMNQKRLNSSALVYAENYTCKHSKQVKMSYNVNCVQGEWEQQLQLKHTSGGVRTLRGSEVAAEGQKLNVAKSFVSSLSPVAS